MTAPSSRFRPFIILAAIACASFVAVPSARAAPQLRRTRRAIRRTAPVVRASLTQQLRRIEAMARPGEDRMNLNGKPTISANSNPWTEGTFRSMDVALSGERASTLTKTRDGQIWMMFSDGKTVVRQHTFRVGKHSGWLDKGFRVGEEVDVRTTRSADGRTRREATTRRDVKGGRAKYIVTLQ